MRVIVLGRGLELGWSTSNRFVEEVPYRDNRDILSWSQSTRNID